MIALTSDFRNDFRLGADRRLRDSSVYRKAFEQGTKRTGRFLVLLSIGCKSSRLRLGVVASGRTFRRAVDRSRAKRLLREAFRLNRHRLAGDVDIILVAKAAILKAKRQEVERDFLETAAACGILSSDEKVP